MSERTFEMKASVRESVPLLVGLVVSGVIVSAVGATSSSKLTETLMATDTEAPVA